MIKIIKNAPENVAAFKAKGNVNRKDFEVVFDLVQQKVEKFGELNYLLKLDTEVNNFSAGAWINDLLLGIKNLTKWNRCAIVSDNEIVHKITAISDLVTIGEFKAFSHDDFKKALHWVSTGKEKKANNTGIALLAGLAGAVVLNAVHEAVRHNFSNVPEVNKVGEEALGKILSETDTKLDDKELYAATLAGDVVSNALYYAAAATNKGGAVSGLLAGLATVELPKYLGLDDTPVKETKQKQLLTIAYYTLGGLATGLIYKKLKKL